MKERFAWAREVTAAQYDESAAFRARFKAHVAAEQRRDGCLLYTSDAADGLSRRSADLSRWP